MQQLGRYEIGRVLGEGGMGRVYEAVLRGPGGFARDVALKVLHSGSDELRREARLGGLLRHRNLVDVYEVGEQDGTWFAALERCDTGVGWHAPLPPRALVEVGLQVCAALQYAHEELGLVHLDLKPDNLLLADGVVKVADLGIARAEGFDDDRVRGTPRYMAPEQALGLPVDARTDVFALGITLHELAAGWSGGASATLDVGLGNMTAGVPSLDEGADPAEQAPEVPAWLEAIVERCMSPAPEGRYGSMAELAAALEAVEVEGPGLREHIGWVEDHTTAAVLRGTNLVGSRDGFFGREAELADLERALERPGLVTVKGAAGMGKSRLAREAAHRWHGRGRQAWFVDLVDVRTDGELVAALGQATGIPLVGGAPAELLREVADSLARRGPTVLVLDNFEQIVHLGPLVRALLDRAPEVRVLATSRQPLGVAGEQVVELGPVDEQAATALLAARARERGAEVGTDPDLPELARRLDGVPLALELAAGRLGVLSVRDVLDRLGLSLLRRGSDGRHGTLRAALEWSWELLSAVEKRTLSQLSVFAGGFTLEAAEAVLELEGSVLDAVGGLVDRSMVQVLDEDRFGLLVSVRDFASDQLEGRDAVEIRHGRHFAGMGTVQALDDLRTHGGVQRLLAVGAERANLVAALSRAVGRSDLAVAAPVGALAVEVSDQAGPYEDLRSWVDAAVDLPGTVADRALARSYAARVASAVGDARATLARSEEAVALAEQAGSVALACRSMVLRSRSLLGVGRIDEALAVAEDGVARARRANSLRWLGPLLNAQALCLHQLHRSEEAEPLYQEALLAYRQVGNRTSEAATLGNLGGLLQQRGELEAARVSYDAALQIVRDVGNRRSEGIWMGNLGILLRRMGRPDEAREHYRAALAIHREVGNGSHLCTVLSNWGRVEAEAGNLERGRAMFEESLQVCRQLGQRHSEAVALVNLGSLARMEGDREQARALLQEGLDLAESMGDKDLIGPVRALIASLDEEGG